MKDTDIFHAAAMTYGLGERLDLPNDPYWSFFMGDAERMIANAKSALPRLPHVHFDFIASHDLNAYAFKAEGRHFIGMCAGTLLLLDIVFSRIMSDRRFLLGIGNVQLEKEEPQSLVGLTRNSATSIAAGLRSVQPKCRTRHEYKDRLLEWAFLFLMAHEMGHIEGGHVDYWWAALNLPFLAELGWTAQTESEGLTRQTLEMEADNQAAGGMMGNMPIMVKDFNLSLELCVIGSVFAFSTVYHLFGDTKFTGQESMQAYPPHRVRQMISAELTALMIKNWSADVREKCLAAHREAYHAVEYIIPQLTGRPPSVEGMKEAFDKTGRDYAEKLIFHRDSVTMPALRAYQYYDHDPKLSPSGGYKSWTPPSNN